VDVTSVRIAIPVPHSSDGEYSMRTLTRFLVALRAVSRSLELIPIELNGSNLNELDSCGGIILPGTPNNIDPARYGAVAGPTVLEPDEARDSMDDLLLHRAFDIRLPILGVCHGLQASNVFTGGTLLQNISSEKIDHGVGEDERIAHSVELDPKYTVFRELETDARSGIRFPVNSNHHQAVLSVGSGLRVCARSQDGIVEAVEGNDPSHFIFGVQWHPEALSKGLAARGSIFQAFLDAAQTGLIKTSVFAMPNERTGSQFVCES
jgi:putative glutamine amidotransferase